MSNRVTFTDSAAKRIARTVLAFEAGDRSSTGLQYGPAYFSPPPVFRICTFTGTWNIDTDRTVTFRNVTSTPNTLVATNLFASVGGGGTADNYACAIGRDGTAWYLIAAKCTSTCQST